MRAHEVLKVATAYEPQLRAATALALAAAPDEAEAVLRRLRGVRPEDTLLRGVYFPVAEGAVLLARGRLDAAVETLRPAARYEFGTVAALAPVFLRASARLHQGAAAEAAGEFRALIEHRGTDPFSPLWPLSQLGLARALAAAGSVAESSKAYEELMRTWASADPDLPILQQARQEIARHATTPDAVSPR